MPAFFEVNRPPSGMFPQTDESAAERLIRRKRVGLARVRRHKGKYLEGDFSFPAGVKLPRFRVYASNATQMLALIHDWSARIREHGALARALTTSQRWVAAECFRIMAELGYGDDPAQLLYVIRDHRDRHPLLPACRAYLALGMFAGLRPESEIEPLEWKHVDLESATIRIKAANAKDRDRRIVEIQPSLAAWLRPLVKVRGRVLEYPVAKLRAAARTVLGLAEWPADVMRHTFVSYHFAEFQNEAYTKKQVGHRDDGRVFYNHYMVPVSRSDARLFWATVPPVALLN